MCTTAVALKVLFVSMEIVNEIWQSPLGEEFRKWYKEQQQPPQKPEPPKPAK